MISVLLEYDASHSSISLNQTSSERKAYISNQSPKESIVTHLFPPSKAMMGGFAFGSNLQACSEMATAIPDAISEAVPAAEIWKWTEQNFEF